MKLIVLMSLEQYRDKVRKVFENHKVHIYSEMEITGHTADTIRQYGWWVFEKPNVPIYSTLFFAVIAQDKADEIMNDITNLRDQFDPKHPPRAFQMDVEKMV